ELLVMLNLLRNHRIRRQLVTPDLQKFTLMRNDLPSFQSELQITEPRAVAVGLHDQRSSLRMHERLFDSPMSVTTDENVYAFDLATKSYIFIEIALDFRASFGVGLLRPGLSLVRQHYDQINLGL